MKKYLLILLAALGCAGMVRAQDIYTAGYYLSGGNSVAAVYKNGGVLYQLGVSSYDYLSTDVVCHNGDVYWVMNRWESDSYADIYKNGERYLNSPVGEGRWINALYHGYNLWSAGYMDVNGVQTAVLWVNNNATPHYILGNGNRTSWARDVCVGTDGYVYTAGCQNTSSSTRKGIVWKNSEQFIDFGASFEPRAIAYYDGDIYTVGNYMDGSYSRVRVYRNSQPMYTYAIRTYARDIAIDAGDVYVVGEDRNNSDRKVYVWKNGNVLHQVNNTLGLACSVTANSKGVYYAYSHTIWKDGNMQYQLSSCDEIYGMYIAEPGCTNSVVRSLPFTDGFENGSTDWACWTKRDVDGNNGGRASHWERCGERLSPSVLIGSHCAKHRFNNNAQEGWLISPRLFLQPGREYTMLTFSTYEQYPDDYTYEGVWISTTNTNASSFTQVWTQSSPSGSWKTVTVDLAAYQGQAVYIAFKYTGQNGHSWYIDEVEVTEGWQPCTVHNVPFTETFSSEIDGCWYIYDSDQSGDGRHWKWNASEQCAYHPYGQQGVPQYGCLISRRVDLPAGHDYVLKFKTKSTSTGAGKANKIYLKRDVTGVPNPGQFTTLIWTDTQFSDSWTEVEVPLSQHAGHNISLSFEYNGTWAHNWYIDDVRIEQAIAQYTITVNANNNAWGSVSGGGVYNQGASCTVSAVPESGYEFQNWKKNGQVVSTNPNYTFTVTENATYTATFGVVPINYYTITTNVTPSGAGTVSGGGTFAEGSTITLTATANAGYTFGQWQDGNTQNPRTITVTQNATYTAQFTQNQYTVTASASPANGGTVSGGGTYNHGASCTLTAVPAAGYEFQNWKKNGQVVSSSPNYTFNVTESANYTAHFGEVSVTYYTITTNVSPTGAGTVTGGGTYEAGSTIVLTATANPGYTFSQWNDGSTQNPRTITVTQNATYTANFTQNQYTITVVASPSNAGTVSGGGAFYYGDVATLTATAYSGYEFVGWSDGSTENPHQVTVTGNATYTAIFSQQGATYYTVTTYVSPIGAGTVTGAGTYEAGSTVTLSATANAGYTFSQWNDGSTQNPRTVTVNNNMSFTAFFTTNQYTITVVASPTAGGTVTGGGTYAYGASAVLTATPNANYEFMQWSDGIIDNPRFVTVTGNATYTALFITEGGETFTLTVRANFPLLGQTFGSGTYPAGSSVEISAYPNAYARFARWNDGNTDNPRMVVVNSDMEFVAEFVAGQSYTLTVESADPNMGNTYGSGTYGEGDQVQISAVAFSGFLFDKWHDGNLDNPRTVTVTGDATYTAHFVSSGVVTHTLTLICNTGEGTVSGGGVYVHGATAVIQAYPNDGYSFSKWSDENLDNPRTLTVTEDMTLVAFFGTGVGENEESTYVLYPNPAKKSIRILGIEPNSSLQIYNTLGELVRIVNAGPDDDISVDGLADGLYVVRCGNVVLRFVKQR